MALQLGEAQTFQFRKFQGVNQTDQRPAIEDTEFSWLENAQPIGAGNVQIIPGPGAAIATLSSPISTLWGILLSGSSFFLSIHTDGSIRKITTGGTVTLVAAAGSVTSSARLTMWKDTTVLIIDPTKGYFSSDGITLSTIDATKTGTDVAVFQGRAWLVTASRTITFTSPNSFTDFVAANGSGSVTITDVAFPGSVTRLLSALEQLWILGPGAVESLTNVSTTGGVTTFSLTNIVSNIGTTFPQTVTAFFRTLVFLTPYGVYAVVGATPQKLSEKLDLLFPLLTLPTTAPAAIGAVANVFLWCVLVTYNDPLTSPSGLPPGARPLILCFSQGKWFFAAKDSLTWITSLLVNGVPQIWGTDGTNIFQLFADSTKTVSYKIQTKLWDFEDSSQMKELLRVGFEFQSSNNVNIALTLESENKQQNQPLSVTFFNTLVWTGLGGAVLTFTGSGGVAITWVLAGLLLVRQSTQFLGRELGLTLQGTTAQWTLSALLLHVKPGGKWS